MKRCRFLLALATVPRSSLLAAGLRAWLAMMVCALTDPRAADAGEAWTKQHWRNGDGLPDNSVSGVVQLADGAILAATHAGLARFDGVRWSALEGEPAAARSATIREMLLARDGAVWLALPHGVVLRRSPAGVETYATGRGATVFPSGLCEDRVGGLWVGYTDGFAARIAEGKVALSGADQGLRPPAGVRLAADGFGAVWAISKGQVLSVENARFSSVPGAAVPDATVVTGGRKGGLWVGSGTSLLRFSPSAGVTKLGAVRSADVKGVISRLFEDRRGRVWVGKTDGQLWLWTGTQFQDAGHFGGAIISLADDHEDNLWVGTLGNGIARVRRRVLATLGSREALPDEAVRSVCRDVADRIWMVTETGALLRREGAEWQRLSPSAEWPGGLATCVAADAGGSVWIGTLDQGIFRWEDGQFHHVPLPGPKPWGQIRALLTARDGALWAALGADLWRWRDGAWKPFRAPPGDAYLQTLAEDAAGAVWAGSSDGRLLAVEGDALADRTPAAWRGDSAIRGLLATPDGALWIGRSADGLGWLKAGRSAQVGKAQGLPQRGTSQLVLDTQGRLWAAGDQGIFCVPLQDLEAVAEGRAARVQPLCFGRSDALPSLQANRGYGPKNITDANGHLWFTTQTAVVLVDPSAVGTNGAPPPVAIEEVRVDDIPQPRPVRGTTLQLPPDHRRIEIAFAAMSFAVPENVRARYRLDPLDDTWRESGPERRAVFSRLPAGDYTFRVSACNNDGVWNEHGAALALHVAPFVWQTAWFRALALFGFAGAVALAARAVLARRWRRQRETLERAAALAHERTRIARDMHDELGASLTQIAISGKLAGLEPEAAGAHVADIAAIARRAVTSLDEIVWAVDPRNDSLRSLLGYLGNHAAEFLAAAGVRCELVIPDAAPDRPLAAEFRHHLFLVVKEALNNAVKYAGASCVRLSVEIRAEALSVVIADDGCGFDTGAAHADSNGLRNMRARAAELGGACRIESRPGAGTEVGFALPWAAAKPIT